MNRAKLIERFNALYPDQDPAAVWDWANQATEHDTVLVPLNYVDEMCTATARHMGVDVD